MASSQDVIHAAPLLCKKISACSCSAEREEPPPHPQPSRASDDVKTPLPQISVVCSVAAVCACASKQARAEPGQAAAAPPPPHAAFLPPSPAHSPIIIDITLASGEPRFPGHFFPFPSLGESRALPPLPIHCFPRAWLWFAPAATAASSSGLPARSQVSCSQGCGGWLARCCSWLSGQAGCDRCPRWLACKVAG